MKSKYKTQLICVTKNTTVREAREIMNERRIRHLPVIDNEHTIVGIVSRTDLTDISQFQDIPVELFSSKPVEYVRNSLPLRQVTLSMLEKKISCVLVTDDHDEVTGIITTDDLLYHLAELLKTADSSENIKTESSEKSIFSVDSLITIGEFSRKLSAMGI